MEQVYFMMEHYNEKKMKTYKLKDVLRLEELKLLKCPERWKKTAEE